MTLAARGSCAVVEMHAVGGALPRDRVGDVSVRSLAGVVAGVEQVVAGAPDQGVSRDRGPVLVHTGLPVVELAVEPVVAGPSVDRVGARAAAHEVVASAGQDRVVAGGADDHVTPVPRTTVAPGFATIVARTR